MKKVIIESWRKNGLKGGLHNSTTNREFRATTATESKGYKTYKSAVKFLERKGYERV
jgi:hypothetical protein